MAFPGRLASALIVTAALALLLVATATGQGDAGAASVPSIELDGENSPATGPASSELRSRRCSRRV